MDRKRTAIGVLLGLSLSLMACQSDTPLDTSEAGPDILKWAQPGTDWVGLLSTELSECLIPTDDKKQKADIALGRMAFRSPFLLGGQAARRGLTCQACHMNGQTSPDFFVVGISDTPGTADVTSFHFSDVLGDEVFNPVPIPNLSDDLRGVDHDPNRDDLEIFVHRLITKEFTGPEPTEDVKSALLTYIRSLDQEQCAENTLSERALMTHHQSIIQESFAALGQNGFKPKAQDFLIKSLRIELGRFYARFPYSQELRESIVAISQQLRSGEVKLAHAAWDELADNIDAAYSKSLYSTDKIYDWLDYRLGR